MLSGPKIGGSWVGGQKIFTFCFQPHRSARRGAVGNWASWKALAYSLGQHWLQVGLAAGGVIHFGAGRQRVFFDREAE